MSGIEAQNITYIRRYYVDSGWIPDDSGRNPPEFLEFRRISGGMESIDLILGGTVRGVLDFPCLVEYILLNWPLC